MTNQEIISKLPYSNPFLFVDELSSVNENGVEGCYTFDENLDFYKGHIFLLDLSFRKNTSIALTSSNIEFLKPVFPKEKVTVISEKIYFRFGKLKCKVKMKNENGDLVCIGEIAGMIT